MNSIFERVNWKIFLASFVAVFIMAGLPHLGITLAPEKNNFAKELLNPQNSKETADPVEVVIPMLSKTPNDFSLKKDNRFITTTKASGEYTDAAGYVAIDFETGKILDSKNSAKQLPIASLTKVMTSVVALDLASPEETFTITQKAADQIPTKLGMVVGQKMTVEELINAMILTSANDATEVVMEGIDQKYGEGTFIKAMNAKAKFLGLSNSNFTNPQGFDIGRNYSSPEDMAILSHYAITKYPLLAQIAKKDYQFYPESSNHKQIDMNNWNGLLGVYPGVQGLKIGNTGDAKYTTIVVSEREGKKVIAVLLGAPGVLQRDLWTSQLLDNAFMNLSGMKPVNITEKQLKEKYSSWKYWN